MPRSLRLAPVAALLAFAVSGCVQITDETSDQLDLIGDVVVRTSLCAEGAEIDTRRSAGTCGLNDIGRAQLLVAHRIPSSSEPVAAPAGLEPSESYAAELERLHPTGDGERWVGWIGAEVDYGIARVTGEVTARFTLPDGAPYRGPFPATTVVGYRRGASGPVDCAAAETVCETDASSRDQPTRDLAILPGDEVTIVAGDKGRVPFRAVFAGEDHPDLEFAIGTSSGSPTQSTFRPGADGETPLDAVVAVPADAQAGRQKVRMTARLANGQERSGETTFRVVPAPENVAQEAAPRREEVVGAEPRLVVAASRACVSRRTVLVRLRGARGEVRRVRVNGRPVAFRTQGRTRVLVDLRGLPKRRYPIRIAARLSDGSVVVDRRRYWTCTPKIRRGRAT